jgi:hypothetical protein
LLTLRRARLLLRSTPRRQGRRYEVLTKDIFERVAATFIQAFLAVWIIGGDIGNAKAAGLAGATAVLSFIKGLLASRFGDGTAGVG